VKVKNPMDMLDTDVIINAFDAMGRVVGIYISRTSGVEYKVRYYLDGKQNDTYFYDYELSRAV
jgi:hypothetical protein